MAESGEGSYREINKPKQSFFSKVRNILLGTTIVAGGATATEATLHPVQTAAENIAGVAEQVSKDIASKTGDILSDAEGSAIYGKYLNRHEDGSFVLSDKPQVVKVKYVPNADSTTKHWNGSNIVVRRKPEADFGGRDVSPQAIGSPYAVRVAGGAFGGPSEVTRFQVTDSSGQKHTVGEWFELSDDQGNPVKLDGTPLQEDENPYFTAANFVTVEGSQTPAGIAPNPTSE